MPSSRRHKKTEDAGILSSFFAPHSQTSMQQQPPLPHSRKEHVHRLRSLRSARPNRIILWHASSDYDDVRLHLMKTLIVLFRPEQEYYARIESHVSGVSNKTKEMKSLATTTCVLETICDGDLEFLEELRAIGRTTQTDADRIETLRQMILNSLQRRPRSRARDA